MKVNYEYNKENLRRFILESRRINNLILLIVGTLIYLWITYKNVELIYLPLFIIAYIIVLFLLNRLYVFAYFKMNEMLNYDICGKYILELTPNKFSLTINNKKTDYKYKDIKKIKEKKKYFIVLLGKREALTFEKYIFKDDEYNKILDYFKSKYKKN